MFEIVDKSPDGAVLRLKISDTLTRENYHAMITVLEDAITAHSKISLMVELTALGSAEFRTLLDGLAFDLRHINDFDRIAMVGGAGWQDWMISVTSHLTSSDMRYFDVDDADAA